MSVDFSTYFDRGMNVRVLFESGRRGEGFAALGTSVSASADVR